MAGTRTVHRGSRGRFAGASSGRAEKVAVGRRSLSSQAKSSTVARRPTTSAARPKSKAVYKVIGRPNSRKRTQFSKRALQVTAVGVVGATVAYQARNYAGLHGLPTSPRMRTNVAERVAAASVIRKTHATNSVLGRAEGIPMARAGVSLREAAKAAGAGGARRSGPNYGLAKGRKEYVGRRVTDGNYGFKLRGK